MREGGGGTSLSSKHILVLIKHPKMILIPVDKEPDVTRGDVEMGEDGPKQIISSQPHLREMTGTIGKEK